MICVRYQNATSRLKTSCAFPLTRVIAFDSSSEPKERRYSHMRYELNQLNKAMIGALQDCLLSANPR